MRKQFESSFSSTSPRSLRKLAEDIAEFKCADAKNACFFSASPPPYNFLANGVATNYQRLTPITSPFGIARWKFPKAKINCCLERGFCDVEITPSSLGLSLMFDPMVDAFLAANTGISSGTYTNPTVKTLIILSDYGAIFDRAINVIGFNGNDWGEDETWKILRPPTPINRNKFDKTLGNLLDSICGGNSWQTNPAMIESAINNKSIFLWNFMPFLRGGEESSNDGLPIHGCTWLNQCLIWLDLLVSIIKPHQVVWCTNSDIKEMVLVRVKKLTLHKNPCKAKAQFNGKDYDTHVLNHPCSWKGIKDPNSNYLINIL